MDRTVRNDGRGRTLDWMTDDRQEDDIRTDRDGPQDWAVQDDIGAPRRPLKAEAGRVRRCGRCWESHGDEAALDADNVRAG